MKMDKTDGVQSDSKELFLASALYDSVEDEDLNAIKILLSKGANPNYVLPLKGIAPFHIIIGNESKQFALEVTKLMLQCGADTNLKTDEDITPLHIAASWNCLEILQLLLHNGADPECVDINNKKALDYAQKDGYTDCCNLLNSYTEAVHKEATFETCKVNITLDKIIVSNGVCQGEYSSKNNSNDKLLKKLPEFSKDDYVNSWFNNFNQSEIQLLKEIEQNSLLDESGHSNFDSVDVKKLCCKYDGAKKLIKEITIEEIQSEEEISMSSVSLYSLESGVQSLPNKSDNLQSLSDTPYRRITTECTPIQRNTLPNNTEERSIIIINSSEEDNDDELNVTEHNTLPNNAKESSVIVINSPDELNVTFNIDSFDKTNSTDNYKTCSNVSNKLDQNLNFKDLYSVIFTSDDSINSEAIKPVNTSTDLSFVSVSEVYKYIDDDEGVVLYERRFLKKSLDALENVSDKRESLASKASSLPKSIDYDTDTLRQELTLHGYQAGPITKSTKRVYLKKLYHLKTTNPVDVKIDKAVKTTKSFSVELQKTLRDPNWLSKDLPKFKSLEEVLVEQFNNPNPKTKWREGILKSSFTYILLDPRITNNLPEQADSLKPEEIWKQFLTAIFYVGKGKRARPYFHLYQAVNLWKNNIIKTSNKKLQTILDIWRGNQGVICLHVFQNIIPVEAYTREAAMISALKIDNLCNMKQGDFYGIVATWPSKDKKLLGVYLLYKAMKILMHEGERQLSPSDID